MAKHIMLTVIGIQFMNLAVLKIEVEKLISAHDSES